MRAAVQKLLLEDLESNLTYYEVKNAIAVINQNKEEHQKAMETIVKAVRFKFGKRFKKLNKRNKLA